MSLKKSSHTHSLKLNEPSPSALNPEMQWLRDQLLEGAASEPGDPFSKEYFRKLINRRKQQGEHSSEQSFHVKGLIKIYKKLLLTTTSRRVKSSDQTLFTSSRPLKI